MDMIEQLETKDQWQAYKKFDAKIREIATALAAYEAGHTPDQVRELRITSWSFVKGSPNRGHAEDTIHVRGSMVVEVPDGWPMAKYSEDYDRDVVTPQLYINFKESWLWTDQWRSEVKKKGLLAQMTWARIHVDQLREALKEIETKRVPELNKKLQEKLNKAESLKMELAAMGVDFDATE